MEMTTKSTESSDLFRKIDALGLPPHERARALLALEWAEKIANAIESVFKLLRLAPNRVAPKPKLRHL
jgi:hypothetical protein